MKCLLCSYVQGVPLVTKLVFFSPLKFVLYVYVLLTIVHFITVGNRFFTGWLKTCLIREISEHYPRALFRKSIVPWICVQKSLAIGFLCVVLYQEGNLVSFENSFL